MKSESDQTEPSLLIHAFPTCFDKEILETGFTACIKSNSVIMAAPGMVNGVQGFYTVGINNSGIIYHRCFYAAQDFYRSFPNSILP